MHKRRAEREGAAAERPLSIARVVLVAHRIGVDLCRAKAMSLMVATNHTVVEVRKKAFTECAFYCVVP